MPEKWLIYEIYSNLRENKKEKFPLLPDSLGKETLSLEKW